MNNLIIPPPSNRLDAHDRDSHKHGREKHNGNPVGIYLQPPPMIFNRDGHNMWFGDMYKGRNAFLILGGPSFKNVDQELLNKPGVLTMGVNNSVKSFRPDLWTCVDHPGGFIKSIWLDPKIMKFVPYSHTEKFLFDNEKWENTKTIVGSCPNVWYYRRNENFRENQYLFEDTFNWGNHGDLGGGRSVMLVAIRLLFYLGVRQVFLLGCDFHMDENTKYHFQQNRSRGSIKGNNSTYAKLIERFKLLKPIFDDIGFNIYNCNENSGLKVFPYVPFKEAIDISVEEMPKDIVNERTEGLYDRPKDQK